MDIKPPRPRRPIPGPIEPIDKPDMPLPVSLDTIDETPVVKKAVWKKRVLIIVSSILGLALLVSIIGWVWYQNQLKPVGINPNEYVTVVIESGMSPDQIGEMLEAEKVIRSQLAFEIYTRLSGTRGLLQAGTYKLSPSDSTQEIVGHLEKGNVDTFSLTFYPGATLVDNTDKPSSQKLDVTTVLLSAGFSQADITAGLSKNYGHPLFEGAPATASLEGFVWGDTYNFATGATVEQILERTFDEFYEVIEENDFKDKFADHKLSLYQGIILASIVQREAIGGDEPRIAQVFYTRLSTGMMLGSDVTYQYIADRDGLVRDPGLESPYNTRVVTGLTPGPIAVPGLAALKAVADPATTDYVYFLSGDDDVTYFARTNEEHEANIRDHCQVKCATP